MDDFIVKIADDADKVFAEEICFEMQESAKARGTGIAKRSPDYIRQKMEEGKAIIALTKARKFVGFCYIETWGHGKYIANSGLIVTPSYRKTGVATAIKEKAFKLSRKKYPDAKLFGLTTSLAVMKINSDLGYYPVPYSELTTDEQFWKGCTSCVNYQILQSKEQKNCICTGMLYDPHAKKMKKWDFLKKSKAWKRLIKIKEAVFTKNLYSKEKIAASVKALLLFSKKLKVTHES